MVRLCYHPLGLGGTSHSILSWPFNNFHAFPLQSWAAMIFTNDDKGNTPSDLPPAPPSTSKVSTYFRPTPAPAAHSRHRTPKRRYSIKDQRQEMTSNAPPPQRALRPIVTRSNSTAASSPNRNFKNFANERAANNLGAITNDRTPFVFVPSFPIQSSG